MRYGDHHARSVDGLTWLLSHRPEFPPEEIPVLLSARRALLAAHRERCERAVRGADVYSAIFENQRRERDLVGLARGGAVALRHLLDQYPTMDERAIRFTDALQAEDPSPYGRAWLETARHAVLATEALVTNPGWTEEPGQAWQVIADVCDSAEATVAIDRELFLGPLSEVPGVRKALNIPTAELRMVARHVGGVARAGDFDPALDVLTRSEPVARPISLLGRHDLARGARATERLLRRSQLSVRDLRSYALIQSDIAHTCAEMITDPRLRSLREAFERRDEHFRALAAATARVASVGPSSGRAVLAQSQEVGRVLLEARRGGQSVNMGDLADFNEAQPQLAETLAANIRQGLATGRYLVVDDSELTLRWRRTEPGEETNIVRAVESAAVFKASKSAGADVDFAAQRIASSEQAHVDPHAAGAEASRGRLRSMLDVQPYGRRPLTPNRVPSSRL